MANKSRRKARCLKHKDCLIPIYFHNKRLWREEIFSFARKWKRVFLWCGQRTQRFSCTVKKILMNNCNYSIIMIDSKISITPFCHDFLQNKFSYFSSMNFLKINFLWNFIKQFSFLTRNILCKSILLNLVRKLL